jgi:hypothetical protein
MSSVHNSTRRSRQPRDAFVYHNIAIALCSATPYDAAGWSGEQQYRQHDQRSSGKGEEKCSEKAQPTVYAAEPGQSAKNYVDAGLEHGPGLAGRKLWDVGGWHHF